MPLIGRPALLALRLAALAALAHACIASQSEPVDGAPSVRVWGTGGSGGADGGADDSGTADGGGVGPGTVRVNLSGYTSYVGELARMKVKDLAGATQGPHATANISDAGTGVLEVAGALGDGGVFRADIFIDRNRDGLCSGPCGTLAGEPAWRRSVTGSPAGATLDLVYSATGMVDISPF